MVFYSLDWHPSDHISFIDNIKTRPIHKTSPLDADSAQVFDTVVFEGPPTMKQRLWPRHCVQDSWGSELHKDLKIVENSVKVYKGTNPEIDSYSVFWDNAKMSETTLNAQLKMKGITDIYVCGLAYDVCVGATAVDAISSGYRTILLDDCCRGVDLKDIENVKEKVVATNGVVATSNEVKICILSEFTCIHHHFCRFFNFKKIPLIPKLLFTGQGNGWRQRSSSWARIQAGHGTE